MTETHVEKLKELLEDAVRNYDQAQYNLSKAVGTLREDYLRGLVESRKEAVAALTYAVEKLS